MLPFDLLRIPVFSMSVLTSIVSFTAQMMALVAIPFMLLHTFGMNAVETGLLMTSWPLVIVFVAPLAGSLIGKVHPGILGCFGLLLMSTGCFLLSYIPADASHPDIRLVGQSTGAALVALFFHLFGDGAPHDAMLLAGALTICGALSSVIRLGLRPPVNER